MKTRVSFSIVFGFITLLILFIACSDFSRAEETFTVPISSPVEEYADPWVIYRDGYYYYCHSKPGEVISVSKTKRLQDVTRVPFVDVWKAPENTMFSKDLWAPELFFLDGKWYIYVAADDDTNENHRMYVLEGTDPRDPQKPFVMKGKISDTTDRWAIDGTVVSYKDKLYFVWSGWEGLENVSQQLYIAPMSNPWTISGERVEISRPEYLWETIGMPHVNEGPTALYRNGKIHIIYSASVSWSEYYCLGQLTFSGGDILDPKNWVKKSTPVFRIAPTAYGPGHASFTKSPDGTEDWIVYHANDKSGAGWAHRSVRIQKFTWDKDDNPVFGTPMPSGIEQLAPSGTPPAGTTD